MVVPAPAGVPAVALLVAHSLLGAIATAI